MTRLLPVIILLFSTAIQAQENIVQRVEPPCWWTGFKSPDLQLMVYGKEIASATVSVDYPGFTIKRIHKVKNPNYLFLDVVISPGARQGIAPILFKLKDKIVGKYLYELKSRKKGSAARKGFSSSDVIYLLTPDRFANGDTTNDRITGMTEPADRRLQDGRHGGDIKGIMDHLSYFKELGVTALWINPLLENNQPTYSYHGYSTTDNYRIDPRFGTNADYLKLTEALHQQGIKVIMDMIFNHCGSEHWWMKDLPSDDWLNQWPEFTWTNYRAGTASDPYSSQYDSALFVSGWFDRTMPDLNQNNPYLKNYLVQNSIWWIEYAGLDGIRQDTHPYPFKEFMAEWGRRLATEYPNFNVVGECWMNYPASVAYWQKDALNKDRYNSWLPSVFDFPLYDALGKAFNEKEDWNTGILRLYEILAQDMSYPNPNNIVTFADNHDVNRFANTQNDDIRKQKMALSFILTTRGIPQIFYGTEIMMTTTGTDKGHGIIRQDFPGGWIRDEKNAFTAEGRTGVQNEIFNFTKTILNWRKTAEVIHTGKLRHFIPKDGIYTYFRYDRNNAVMVVLNNNDAPANLETTRYREFLKKYKTGTDIITGIKITDLSKLDIPAKGVLILDLK